LLEQVRARLVAARDEARLRRGEALEPSAAEDRPLIFAGSFSGPTMTKSLYMTRRRLSILPSSTYFFSSAGAWASVTSASPREARASAWPVPTEIVFTVSPDVFSNIGTRTSSRPESWVLVVVERMTVDWARAASGGALAVRTTRPARAR
jgi:hypothetical protein